MRLCAEALVLSYGARCVVDHVSLVVEPGDMVAIVGPNGSGKSTLLRGLARIHRPAAGRVVLGDRDIRSMGGREVARVLAILPQAPETNADLTVRELVARGRYPHQGILQRLGRHDAEAIEWALNAADLKGLESRPLQSLSGGERQRAWLALALAQEPKVLLLDEPTSFLDIQHQVEVMHILRRLNAQGMTVVCVLHDLVLAARFASRVVAMRAGAITFDGPPHAVFEPSALEAVFGVPMMVIRDPETGAPIPLPRPDPALCPVGPGQASRTP
jgi:iron complex transport system ATP-binding protein